MVAFGSFRKARTIAFRRLCVLAGCLVLTAGGCTVESNLTPTAAIAPLSSRDGARAGDYLYVADFSFGGGRVVSVYAPDGTKFVRQILVPNGAAPCGLAFDPSNDLYVGDNEQDVYAFRRGSTKRFRTIVTDSKRHCLLAFDTAGDLYVTNTPTYPYDDGSISVYAPHRSTPVGTITDGIDHPSALLFDASGDLYVSNLGDNSVTEYAKGKTQGERSITRGVKTPHALAVDSSGNLYVANDGTWRKTHFVGSSVSVYGAGSQPLLTIGKGIDAPDALALDASENLYVANDPPLNEASGSVAVYAAGTTHLIRTITKGIDKPTALALDRSGNLYVANARGLELGSVTVYAPGRSTPTRTITTYVQGPVALGLDPY